MRAHFLHSLPNSKLNSFHWGIRKRAYDYMLNIVFILFAFYFILRDFKCHTRLVVIAAIKLISMQSSFSHLMMDIDAWWRGTNENEKLRHLLKIVQELRNHNVEERKWSRRTERAIEGQTARGGGGSVTHSKWIENWIKVSVCRRRNCVCCWLHHHLSYARVPTMFNVHEIFWLIISVFARKPKSSLHVLVCVMQHTA